MNPYPTSTVVDPWKVIRLKLLQQSRSNSYKCYCRVLMCRILFKYDKNKLNNLVCLKLAAWSWKLGHIHCYLEEISLSIVRTYLQDFVIKNMLITLIYDYSWSIKTFMGPMYGTLISHIWVGVFYNESLKEIFKLHL